VGCSSSLSLSLSSAVVVGVVVEFNSRRRCLDLAFALALEDKIDMASFTSIPVVVVVSCCSLFGRDSFSGDGVVFVVVVVVIGGGKVISWMELGGVGGWEEEGVC